MPIVAIFASGSGTNAENLIKNYKGSEISVARVYCNNPSAGVIARAERLQVPVTIFKKTDLYEGIVTKQLADEHVDFIILAGFMMLLPPEFIHNYNGKILNIHPSLLPKYGGKGMYGHHVHEAVLANHEKQSGITIHLVNEMYDSGRILFQAMCMVKENDTADTLATRVHALEYAHYPEVAKRYMLGL